MKNSKVYLLGFLAITLMGLFFAQCESNSNNDLMQTSRVTVRMTDAPGDYDQVNVEVLDVLIKNSANTDDQGWVSIGDATKVGNGKIYNLLDLTGGVNALLADNLVPSGNLGQIRLLLGDENSLKLKGATTTIPLNTPSAQQSGLKLQVNQTLEAGKTYEFLLDFDVEHSVVKAGNSGIYNLHPVIRVSTKENTGGIKGKITSPSPFPAGFAVLASIPVEGGTIEAAMNAVTGEFQLNGVPSGTYVVTLDPGATSLYAVKTIANVVVVNGAITDVVNQTLVLKP
jgi:hypothetical protein